MTATRTDRQGGALGHRCRCGHWDRDHSLVEGYLVRGGFSCRHYRCGCDDPGQWGPTEIYPLYLGGLRGDKLLEADAGRRVDYLIPPGTTQHAHRSCSCPDCRAFYAAWTANHARSTT